MKERSCDETDLQGWKIEGVVRKKKGWKMERVEDGRKVVGGRKVMRWTKVAKWKEGRDIKKGKRRREIYRPGKLGNDKRLQDETRAAR